MVYSGLGYLIFIFIWVPIFIGIFLESQQLTYKWVVGILYIILGVVSWFLGKWRENEEERRVMPIFGLGEGRITKFYDTLFWIPIRFWGIIFVIGGILYLIFG